MWVYVIWEEQPQEQNLYNRVVVLKDWVKNIAIQNKQ